MKTYLSIIACLSLLLLPIIAGAQDIFSEDDIFTDTQRVETVQEDQAEQVTAALTENSVGFSGQILGNFQYDVTRDSLDGDANWGDNPYSTAMEGDFMLDVRLQKGIRAFGDLWADYTPHTSAANPDSKNFNALLKEFFVDANLRNTVYFRFGKQNLKCGQGYFWNPTDLLSQDRRDFGNMDARREGVYGLKAHVPFGTNLNLYGFVNATGANHADELAVAGRVEAVVLNDVEFSLSAWKKQDYRAVYGADFTTYRLGTHWRGEISLSRGDNRHRLEKQGGVYVDTQDTDAWIPRFTLGFTRLFDVGNFNDRLNVTGEFYYNHAGYDDDMLADDVRQQFLQGGYFEPGNYGTYYAALFTTFGRFLMTDMALNVNAISNLSDTSLLLSAGLTYLLTFNAQLHWKVDAYLGEQNREYTLGGNALRTRVMLNINF